jgi:hypothetical protein
MTSLLASTFRAVEDPGFARIAPQPWSARHTFNVQCADPDTAVWHVSRWDPERAALIGATAPYAELDAYFQVRARVSTILGELQSPFDVRDTLSIERQRMEPAIADRIYQVWRYARGETPGALQFGGMNAAEDLSDFIRGIEMIIRHDLLSMFAHPRMYASPTLGSGDGDPGDSTRDPVPLGPMDMPHVFASLAAGARQVRSAEAGGDTARVALATHDGANFMSVDRGLSWLRLTLDEPAAGEADAQDFLVRVTDVVGALDAAAVDFAEAGWRARHGDRNLPDCPGCAVRDEGLFSLGDRDVTAVARGLEVAHAVDEYAQQRP